MIGAITGAGYVFESKDGTEGNERFKRAFGFERLSENQLELIEHIVRGGDALLTTPDDASKAFAFQIPATRMDGTCVLISPKYRGSIADATKSSVKGTFQAPGITQRTRHLSSSSFEPLVGLSDEIRNRSVDFIFTTPEIAGTEQFMRFLENSSINLIVIDEADRVSRCGISFENIYRDLRFLKKMSRQIPVLALASVTDRTTRNDIVSQLGLDNVKTLSTGFNFPNIQLQLTVQNEAKAKLLHLLRIRYRESSCIIFVANDQEVAETAKWLTDNGRTTVALCADQKGEIAEKLLPFTRGPANTLVASVEQEFELSCEDVRLIAHLALPPSIEAYYRQVRLAGKDGLPSEAWLSYSPGDALDLKRNAGRLHVDQLEKVIALQKIDVLAGYCESATCRRRILLENFGEETVSTCGNCDLCLSPTPRWDGTAEARMALACVYRTQQRFGMVHLIDVLAGKKNEAVIRHGHDRLECFGAGANMTRKVWQSIFRQLLTAGYLRNDATGFGAIVLSESGVAVLKDELKVYFSGDTRHNRIPKPFTRPMPSRFDPQREQLHHALRERRDAIARSGGVSPQSILGDVTLIDLVRVKPRSRLDLLRVQGMTDQKVERFGEEILEVVAMF